VPEGEGVNMSSLYTCPNCETDLMTDWKYCPKCGKETGFTECDKCGETICCDWKHCPVCGKKL